ncbi:hypothetical protein F4802DRAFT_568990 [Xylaria palmicola]|nr:hypothetical protein F4802DRAFT_568990 [Xylaria palmicola]
MSTTMADGSFREALMEQYKSQYADDQFSLPEVSFDDGLGPTKESSELLRIDSNISRQENMERVIKQAMKLTRVPLSYGWLWVPGEICRIEITDPRSLTVILLRSTPPRWTTQYVVLIVLHSAERRDLERANTILEQIDVSRHPTLGIVMPKDIVEESDERRYQQLVQNEKVYCSLGWHVLDRDAWQVFPATREELERWEDLFPSRLGWPGFSDPRKGLINLGSRLEGIFGDEIRRYFPRMQLQLSRELSESCAELGKLGSDRSTPAEQRRFLSEASQRFAFKLRTAASSSTSNTFAKMQAVIEQGVEDFGITMEHYWDGRVDGIVFTGKDEYMSRENLALTVIPLTESMRLHGLGRIDVLRILFEDETEMWVKMGMSHIRRMIEAAKVPLKEALGCVVDGRTANIIWHHFMQSRLKALEWRMYGRLQALLAQYEPSAPLAIDNQVRRLIQRNQADRPELMRGGKESLGWPFNDTPQADIRGALYTVDWLEVEAFCEVRDTRYKD